MSFEKQKAVTLSLADGVFARNKFENYLWVPPLVACFAVWEAVARLGLVPKANLPTFSSVLVVFFFSIQNTTFLLSVAHSFMDLICGLLLGFCAALPLAFFAGCRNKFDLTLTPLIMLFGAIPDLSFLPLLMLWVGSGNAVSIIMASVVGFFPIYFTVREGTKNIPHDLFDVASIFKTDRISTFTKVILPAISPQMFSGLRLAYDFGWEIIIAIEIVTRVVGIGSFINGNVAAGALQNGFAAILAIALVAIVIDRVFFGSLESWTRKWA